MQHSQAAASQRPPEAPQRSQQLGTTKLGRQRLQKKANSFADMVQLVAFEDVEHSDEPMVLSAPFFHTARLTHAWAYSTDQLRSSLLDALNSIGCYLAGEHRQCYSNGG